MRKILNSMNYARKVYLRDKAVLFWNIFFPLAYATVFLFALGPVMRGEPLKLPPAKIAIVQGIEGQANFQNFIDQISQKKAEQAKANATVEPADKAKTAVEQPSVQDISQQVVAEMKRKDNSAKKADDLQNLPDISLQAVASEAEGNKLLDQQKVQAMITSLNPPVLVYSNNTGNIRMAVIGGLLEQYSKIADIQNGMKRLFTSGKAVLPMSDLVQLPARYKAASTTNFVQNQTVPIKSGYVYAFALLAYLIFFPLSVGYYMIINYSADESPVGLRIAISPIKRIRQFLVALVPAFILHVLIDLGVVRYFRLFDIQIGSQFLWYLLFIVLGVLSAIFVGSAIAAVIPSRMKWRNVLFVAVPLFLGFAAGMMNSSVKFLFDKNLPWLHYISPVALLSQAFYILEAAPSSHTLWLIAANLAAIVLVAFLLTMKGLARPQVQAV